MTALVSRLLVVGFLACGCSSPTGEGGDSSGVPTDLSETRSDSAVAPGDAGADGALHSDLGDDGLAPTGDASGNEWACNDDCNGGDAQGGPSEVAGEDVGAEGGDCASGDSGAACGDLAAGQDTGLSSCPEDPAQPDSAIQGRVYLDGDSSSCSWYDQGFFPKFDSPMAGVEVRLFGPSAEWMTTTCSEGAFQFESLEAGSYLVDVRVPDADDCTSSNQPRRLPEAVAEGEVTIVTMGDSIAVVGQGPLFPEILAGHLAPLADIQNHNIAVSGTHSTDWVPGTSLFKNKLVPELPGADVLIITLGGNDVMAWVGGSLGNYSDLYTKMLELDDFLAGIHANVTAIITEARKINPNIDVVFCLYFNYAQSSYWQKYMGSYQELALAATANAWEKARENVASIPGIILADMYGALEGQLLDPYLSDSVHLSPTGHQFYAEQVFLVLGGARIGQTPLGLSRDYGFHLPTN